jgi:hypothetical protein
LGNTSLLPLRAEGNICKCHLGKKKWKRGREKDKNVFLKRRNDKRWRENWS